MKLTYRHLCRQNVIQLMWLRVRDAEVKLIAPSAEWIAQASLTDKALTFGAFAEEQPVGLISMIDPRCVDDENARSGYRPDCLYIWRLMIDRDYRSLGYGSKLLEFACDYGALIGLDGVSLTTMDTRPGNALPFYEKRGFKPTGQRIDDEIELIRLNS